MTDRIISLTVMLEKEIREDDVQNIVRAIEMIRGVGMVEPGIVADSTFYIAREQAKAELVKQMISIIKPGGV